MQSDNNILKGNHIYNYEQHTQNGLANEKHVCQYFPNCKDYLDISINFYIWRHIRRRTKILL